MEINISLHPMYMRNIFIAVFFLASTFQFTYSQTKRVPKNLKQAVRQLTIDCPDSLKAIIKTTDDKKLFRLSYPLSYSKAPYTMLISDWLSGDNQGTRLDKYFEKKGITYGEHQAAIILIAFKGTILGKKVKNDSIFKPFQQIELKWKQEDAVRETADSLRGVYIPKDVDDCFRQLDRMFVDSDKVIIKHLTEDEFSGRVHLGFGTWLRNNWGLYGGSRLRSYFQNLEITDAESMSSIIFDSYYRHLKGEPLKLDEQIKFIENYWANTRKRNLEEKTKEFDSYKIGDTLNYKYPNGYISQKQEDDYDQICIAKGIVLEKNSQRFFLKMRIIETCDNKGIITYDNKNAYYFDKKAKKLLKEKKHKIIISKKKKELWFNYDDWEFKEGE